MQNAAERRRWLSRRHGGYFIKRLIGHIKDICLKGRLMPLKGYRFV